MLSKDEWIMVWDFLSFEDVFSIRQVCKYFSKWKPKNFYCLIHQSRSNVGPFPLNHLLEFISCEKWTLKMIRSDELEKSVSTYFEFYMLLRYQIQKIQKWKNSTDPIEKSNYYSYICTKHEYHFKGLQYFDFCKFKWNHSEFYTKFDETNQTPFKFVFCLFVCSNNIGNEDVFQSNFFKEPRHEFVFEFLFFEVFSLLLKDENLVSNAKILNLHLGVYNCDVNVIEKLNFALNQLRKWKKIYHFPVKKLAFVINQIKCHEKNNLKLDYLKYWIHCLFIEQLVEDIIITDINSNFQFFSKKLVFDAIPFIYQLTKKPILIEASNATRFYFDYQLLSCIPMRIQLFVSNFEPDELNNFLKNYPNIKQIDFVFDSDEISKKDKKLIHSEFYFCEKIKKKLDLLITNEWRRFWKLCLENDDIVLKRIV